MYFPKDDTIFGSNLLCKNDFTNYSEGNYQQTLWITRTRLKSLNTGNNICDDSQDLEANTTKCITNYMEDKIGCSVGLSGAHPEIER